MNEHQNKIYPGRPPRLSRVFDQTPLYFVTFNTWQRRKLLANDAVHSSFRIYAQKNLQRGIAVGRYVVMPDHIHLFVRIGVERKLEPYVRLMKQAITRALKIETKKKSASQAAHRATTTEPAAISRVWQPGFFDHVMRSGESYSEKWNYVRMNPVRSGLVENPDDWKFQGEIETIFF